MHSCKFYGMAIFFLLEKFLVGFALTVSGTVVLIWYNSLVSHSTIRVDPKYKRLSRTHIGFVVIRPDNCITCHS